MGCPFHQKTGKARTWRREHFRNIQSGRATPVGWCAALLWVVIIIVIGITEYPEKGMEFSVLTYFLYVLISFRVFALLFILKVISASDKIQTVRWDMKQETPSLPLNLLSHSLGLTTINNFFYYPSKIILNKRKRIFLCAWVMLVVYFHSCILGIVLYH